MSHWNRAPDDHAKGGNNNGEFQVPATPLTPPQLFGTPPPHLQRRNTNAFNAADLQAFQQQQNAANNNNASAQQQQQQRTTPVGGGGGGGAFTPVNSSSPGFPLASGAAGGRTGSPPRRPTSTTNSGEGALSGHHGDDDDGAADNNNDDDGGGTPPNDMHFTPTRRQRSPDRRQVPQTPAKSAARGGGAGNNQSNQGNNSSTLFNNNNNGSANRGQMSTPFGGRSGNRFPSAYNGETPARTTQRPASVGTAGRVPCGGASTARRHAHQRGNSDVSGMSSVQRHFAGMPQSFHSSSSAAVAAVHNNSNAAAAAFNRNPFSPGRDLMTTNLDALSLNDPIHHALVVFQHQTGAQQQHHQQHQQQQHGGGTVSPARRSPGASRRSPAVSCLRPARHLRHDSTNSGGNQQQQQQLHSRHESSGGSVQQSPTDSNGMLGSTTMSNNNNNVNVNNNDSDFLQTEEPDVVPKPRATTTTRLHLRTESGGAGGSVPEPPIYMMQQQQGVGSKHNNNNNDADDDFDAVLAGENDTSVGEIVGVDRQQQQRGDDEQLNEVPVPEEEDDDDYFMDDGRSRFGFFFPFPGVDPNRRTDSTDNKKSKANNNTDQDKENGYQQQSQRVRDDDDDDRKQQQQQDDDDDDGGGEEGDDEQYTMSLPIPFTFERNGASWVATAKMDGMTYCIKEVPFAALDEHMLRQRDSARAESVGADPVEQEGRIRESFQLSVDDEIAALTMSRFSANVVRYYSVQHDAEHRCHVIQTEYFGHGSLFEHWVGRRTIIEQPLSASQNSLNNNNNNNNNSNNNHGGQQQSNGQLLQPWLLTPTLGGESPTGGDGTMAGPPPPMGMPSAAMGTPGPYQQQQQPTTVTAEVFVCPSEAEVWRALHDAARGLTVLHRNGFAHNNLHPRSVFVDAGGRCKIGCFGVAKRAPSARQQHQQQEQQQEGHQRNHQQDAQRHSYHGGPAPQWCFCNGDEIVVRSTDSLFLALPALYEPQATREFGMVPPHPVNSIEGSSIRKQDAQQNNNNNSMNDSGLVSDLDTSSDSLNAQQQQQQRRGISPGSSNSNSNNNGRSAAAAAGRPVTLAQLQARDIYSFAAGLVHTLHIAYLQAQRNEHIDLRRDPAALADSSCIADPFRFLTAGCNYSDALATLVAQMLDPNEAARPTASQVVLRISGNRPACSVREAFCDALRSEIFTLQEKLRRLKQASAAMGAGSSTAPESTLATQSQNNNTQSQTQSQSTTNNNNTQGSNSTQNPVAGGGWVPDSAANSPASLFATRSGSSHNLNSLLQGVGSSGNLDSQQNVNNHLRMPSPLGISMNVSPGRNASFASTTTGMGFLASQVQQHQQGSAQSQQQQQQQQQQPSMSFPSQPMSGQSAPPRSQHHHLFEERSGTPVLPPGPSQQPSLGGDNHNNHNNSHAAAVLVEGVSPTGSRPVRNFSNAHNNNNNNNNNNSNPAKVFSSPSSSHLDEDAEVSGFSLKHPSALNINSGNSNSQQQQQQQASSTTPAEQPQPQQQPTLTLPRFDLSQSPIERDNSIYNGSFSQLGSSQQQQGQQQQQVMMSRSQRAKLADVHIPPDSQMLASLMHPSSPLFGVHRDGSGGVSPPTLNNHHHHHHHANFGTRPNSPLGAPHGANNINNNSNQFGDRGAAHTPTPIMMSSRPNSTMMMMFPSGGGGGSSSTGTMVGNNNSNNAAAGNSNGGGGNNNSNSQPTAMHHLRRTPESPLLVHGAAAAAGVSAQRNPQEYEDRVTNILADSNRQRTVNDNVDCSEWLMRLRDPNVTRPAQPLSVRPVNYM